MNTGLKALLVIVSLALLAGGAYYLFFMKNETSQKQCSAVEPTPVIVAFGDSLIAGYGATTSGGFVTLLSKQAGVPITNLGANGNTAGEGLARIDEVIRLKPTIVLVLLGGNDALRKTPQEQTEKNLDAIISRLEKENIHVILIGVPGAYPFADPYADMFVRISKAHNISFIPNILSGIIGHTTLMADVVHPNEKGYQMITDRVYLVLTQVCNLKN